MSSTFTTRGRIEKIAYDEQSDVWATTEGQVKDKWDLITNGTVIVPITSALHTLDAGNGGSGGADSDEACARHIRFTGNLTANTTVIVPSVEKVTLYDNATSGAFTLSVKTAGGAAYLLPQGKCSYVRCDGTTHIDAISQINGNLSVSGTITAAQLSVSGGGTVLDVSGGGTGAGTVSGAYANLTVPGVIQMYAGSVVPTGWLLCDGSAVSRTTYAALYAAFGGASSPYGQGDGATTFNLPDARGRMLVGAGAGVSLTNRVLGATGGTETHTLTTAEMPNHGHVPQALSVTTTSNGGHTHTATTSSDGAHTHNYSTPNASAFGFESGNEFNFATDATSSDGNHTHTLTTSTDGAHTHTVDSWSMTIGNTGGGGAHNNMPPFLAMNVIVKT